MYFICTFTEINSHGIPYFLLVFRLYFMLEHDMKFSIRSFNVSFFQNFPAENYFCTFDGVLNSYGIFYEVFTIRVLFNFFMIHSIRQQSQTWIRFIFSQIHSNSFQIQSKLFIPVLIGLPLKIYSDAKYL